MCRLPQFRWAIVFLLGWTLQSAGAWAQDQTASGQPLRLARIAQGDQVHIIEVTNVTESGIEGIDLSRRHNAYPRFPLDILGVMAAGAIEAGTDDLYRVEVDYEDLLPVIDSPRNVAAGTNFAEHGEEASIDVPFLFPKRAAPDPNIHELVIGDGWLLDYEVELAVVFDQDVTDVADLDKVTAGFFVTNDFTERATLLRKVDTSNPESGLGFADGKGQVGFFPTGPFMVVAHDDWPSFVDGVELELTVNGETRQKDPANLMIWDFKEVIRRALDERGSDRWDFQGQQITLLDDKLPKGMAVLSGTPAGVLFNAPSMGQMAWHATMWIVTFSFTSQDLTTYVKEQTIANLIERGTFLKAGDDVIAKGTGLGSVRTKIITTDE